MPMITTADQKYDHFQPYDLPTRQWPSKRITKAPRWLATDLRDGNQALACPLTVSQKWKYFKMLVDIGFREIDVAFPAASQTEFDFTRKLIETPGAVPDDCWLQVLAPCRKDLIKRTVESVRGAKKAIISLYIASSDAYQKAIFNAGREDIYRMATECVAYAKSLTKDDPTQSGTEWNLMFSPEAFTDSDVEYCAKMCQAVQDIWEPTVENPVILNLPATVEVATPNNYADQVEIFQSFLTDREKVCLSLHPHNDRGCAVAAAELGQMAGAQRVEGCLFGNGERTGNVDLVTLALNLYTQGVNPNLDFSNLLEVKDTVEKLTQIPVHGRAPYAGEFVFRAYSGSHQDAINKAMKTFEAKPAKWDVPYIPVDPRDVGMTFEAVIQVNSQSGKGGVAWTLRHLMDLELPRELQIDFSKHVKRAADQSTRTLLPSEIATLLWDTYHIGTHHPRILTARAYSKSEGEDVGLNSKTIEAEIAGENGAIHLKGAGATTFAAVNNALTRPKGPKFFSFRPFHLPFVRDSDSDENSTMVAVQCIAEGVPEATWGLNASPDVEQAELLASLSAVIALSGDNFA